MKTSAEGIALIKHFESCKLSAYQDSAGIWTIGWGATFYPDGSKVKKGDACTQKQADAMFDIILPKFERKVLGRITRPLKQNEFDAAVCFCYNAGTGYHDKNGAYQDFNLWEHINNKFPGIVEYWKTLAITSKGIKLRGLIRRRKAEAELYNS
jgi:lysozyme